MIEVLKRLAGPYFLGGLAVAVLFITALDKNGNHCI